MTLDIPHRTRPALILLALCVSLSAACASDIAPSERGHAAERDASPDRGADTAGSEGSRASTDGETETDGPEGAPAGHDHDRGLQVEDMASWRTAMGAGGVLFDAGESFRQVSYMLDGEDLFALSWRVRTTPDGPWTAWAPLDITWREDTAAVGRLFLDETAEAFEVRGPEDAISFAAFRFHEEHVADPDVLTRNLPVEVEPKNAALPAWVVTRAQWGARNPGRVCGSSHTPRNITVHHTVTPNNDSLSPAARMRQIQAFHIDGNGWCDVGYHFMVGIDGRVYEGRNNWLRTGAHVRVANRDNVGINLVGNFMSFEPREVQMEGGARIIAWLAQRHGIALDRNRVRGHQEWMATACPGTRLQARLGELVDRARGGDTPAPPTPPAPVDPAPTPGPTGATLVGFIREGNINAADRPVAGATVRTDDGRTTTTNAEGFYRFDGVPLRTYRVTATADGYDPASVTRVVDRSNTLFYASIALEPASRTASLVGFVREGSIQDTDRPIVGATVRIDDGRTATTDAQGLFRFNDVPLGPREVTAEAPGFLPGSASRIVDQADTLFYASIALQPEPVATEPDDGPVAPDGLPRMPVFWERLGDGSWKLQATPPASAAEVVYFVDGFRLGSGTDRAVDFDARHRFEREGVARQLVAVALDAGGTPVAWAMGVLDVTAEVGVYVRQTGEREFEIGVERAPWAVRAIEVIVDDFTLTDLNSGQTRAPAQFLRYRFQSLGERSFVLNTFNADGSYRGTLRRTITLR